MLSIIIPTLNEEKYLPVLLSEIKKQNFTDYEVIVADAYSQDRTREIARDFGCKIVSGGLPAKGRNEGAKIAEGEIFLFMDADNFYLSENFLKDLTAEFKKRNLGVATFPVYPVRESSISNGVYPKGNLVDKCAYWIYNNFANLFQKFSPLATTAVLVKKEIHQKILGFDEGIKIGEDHDYARRAGKISHFGFIKTKPVLTSARRFERDGRLKTYLKYVLAGIWMLFLGPVRSDIFNYRYGYDFLTKLKKKIKYNHMPSNTTSSVLRTKSQTPKNLKNV